VLVKFEVKKDLLPGLRAHSLAFERKERTILTDFSDFLACCILAGGGRAPGIKRFVQM
jgi:hypothetical protein